MIVTIMLITVYLREDVLILISDTIKKAAKDNIIMMTASTFSRLIRSFPSTANQEHPISKKLKIAL